MPANDDHLTPQARIEQLAELLATAILRLRARPVPGDDAPESSATCLEVSPEERLSVPTGLRPREARPANVEPEAGDE